MNIRDNIRKAIYDGLNAEFTQRAGVAGILFHDENEFIPFDDLNYNSTYGYFQISLLPNVERECSNENPETLHWGKDFDDWRPIIWADSGANLSMIGDIHQAADLYQALGRLLLHGEADAEEISENDAAWFYMKPMRWAIGEYREYIGGGRTDDQIGNTIRAAANRGAIRGSSQDAAGAWYFRPESFRGWLVKTRDESRGRPREETTKRVSSLIENFDGDTSALQHNLAKMTRGTTGNIPRGQLWQPCEHPGCDNEPVCMNCMMCQEAHCHCFDAVA